MAYSYTNITTNATTTVHTGRGVLVRIIVNNPGTAWVATIFDSVTGAGPKIGTLSVNANTSFVYEAVFTAGLTIVTSGTTPGDLTVTVG